eukprot:CAMPEP_0115863750 /NCGR_PEP_ID=MMETSP0287-20121206/18846_1 /TAXON_ID=412157 /ORGANISM="Chrysochromulina rotalis, Strain UIO044" /LENGTH=178 /DNA_ID=CAMNT_0003318199 /DNA_START=352 /DNA_END=888 /DNA_ORIENTATION=+
MDVLPGKLLEEILAEAVGSAQPKGVIRVPGCLCHWKHRLVLWVAGGELPPLLTLIRPDDCVSSTPYPDEFGRLCVASLVLGHAANALSIPLCELRILHILGVVQVRWIAEVIRLKEMLLDNRQVCQITEYFSERCARASDDGRIWIALRECCNACIDAADRHEAMHWRIIVLLHVASQ